MDLRILPIFLILFLLIPGCLQTASDEKEQFSEYSFPESEFTMHTPQSWHVEKIIDHSHVRFTHPENRASIDVRITQSTLPEGVEQPGGFGMSYEKPNSTIIESYEKIQISGVPGTRWTFLVNESDRQYIEGFIGVARKCPDRKYDGITYFISYHYTTGDAHLEETVKEMLDSIELSCSSG